MTISERNGNLPYAVEKIIESKGLKKCYIAKRAGMKPNELTSICAGRKLVSVAEIIRLADALEVSPNDLILHVTE